MFKYYYWDMRNIPLNKVKSEEFEKYIDENISDFLLIDDNIYVDTNALGRMFSCCDSVCDCKIEVEGRDDSDIFNRPDRLISMNGYCCDGGCMISKNLVSVINDLFDNYGLPSYFSNEALTFINTFGFYDSFVVGSKVYFKTNTINGRCIFSGYDNGKKHCLLHTFSTIKALNLFETKPFDCSLFPLDIIVDNGVYYITAVTENNSFCRFNEDNKPITFGCIKQNKHGVQLYKFCRNLIIDIFGEMVYDIIEAYYIENRHRFGGDE